MQTQINPALAAAMTLERAAQVGQFQPMTPQGQPTVAAQLMQQAMPPSVPQVAQQAGLAGQIQAMQQQQAQQALMRQAMANRPPAGIEGLNPQMGNFAEGGIVGKTVGYAVAGQAKDPQIPASDNVEIPFTAGTLGPGDFLSELEREANRSEVELAKANAKLQQYGLRQRAEDPEGFARARQERDVASRIYQDLSSRFEREKRVAPSTDRGAFKDASRMSPEEAAVLSGLYRNIPVAPMMAIPEITIGEPGRQAAAATRAEPSAAKPETTAAAPAAAAPAAAPIAAPAAPGAAAPARKPVTGIAALAPESMAFYDQALSKVEGIPKTEAEPSSYVPKGMAIQAARDKMRAELGLPPEMDRISQQEAAYNKLYGEREALLQKRLREIEETKGPGGIAAFLRGFKQMKGQPIGTGFASASESAEAYETSMRQRQERLEDLKLEVQGLKVERQNTLDKMRDDIANGRLAEAKSAADLLRAQEREIALKSADILMNKGKTAGEIGMKGLELDLRAREIQMRYSELQQNKDGQQLLAAQGRVTSAQELRQKAFQKAQPYLAMPDKEVEKDPMLKKMRDNALLELQDIENNVLAPAVQVRDSLYEKVLGVPTPKAKPSESGGPVTVTTSKGSFTFPNQAAADKFKQEAGIK